MPEHGLNKGSKGAMASDAMMPATVRGVGHISFHDAMDDESSVGALQLASDIAPVAMKGTIRRGREQVARATGAVGDGMGSLAPGGR